MGISKQEQKTGIFLIEFPSNPHPSGLISSTLPVHTYAVIVFVFGLFGGLGQSAVIVSGPMIVGRYFVQRRPLANGLIYTAAGLAAALGPLTTSAAMKAIGPDAMPAVSVRATRSCAPTLQIYTYLSLYYLLLLFGAAVFLPPSHWEHKDQPSEIISYTQSSNSLTQTSNSITQRSSNGGEAFALRMMLEFDKNASTLNHCGLGTPACGSLWVNGLRVHLPVHRRIVYSRMELVQTTATASPPSDT